MRFPRYYLHYKLYLSWFSIIVLLTAFPNTLLLGFIKGDRSISFKRLIYLEALIEFSKLDYFSSSIKLLVIFSELYENDLLSV